MNRERIMTALEANLNLNEDVRVVFRRVAEESELCPVNFGYGEFPPIVVSISLTEHWILFNDEFFVFDDLFQMSELFGTRECVSAVTEGQDRSVWSYRPPLSEGYPMFLIQSISEDREVLFRSLRISLRMVFLSIFFPKSNEGN